MSEESTQAPELSLDPNVSILANYAVEYVRNSFQGAKDFSEFQAIQYLIETHMDLVKYHQIHSEVISIMPRWRQWIMRRLTKKYFAGGGDV